MKNPKVRYIVDGTSALRWESPSPSHGARIIAFPAAEKDAENLQQGVWSRTAECLLSRSSLVRSLRTGSLAGQPYGRMTRGNAALMVGVLAFIALASIFISL